MFWRALAIILVLAAGGISYSFLQFRSELHGVYVVPDDHAISTSSDTDLYVVDFLDYSCEFSRKLHPILKEAVERDGKIRYIPRPLVAPDDAMGNEALLFLYATAQQGAFAKVNEKLFEIWPIEKMDVLMDYAKSLGLDTLKIEADMKTSEAMKAVSDNRKYYSDWRFSGTPTILIATEWMGTKAIYIPRDKDTTVRELLEGFEKSRGWF